MHSFQRCRCCVSVCLSGCVSVCLSVCLPVSLSVCLSAGLPVCRSVCRSIGPHAGNACVCGWVGGCGHVGVHVSVSVRGYATAWAHGPEPMVKLKSHNNTYVHACLRARVRPWLDLCMQYMTQQGKLYVWTTRDPLHIERKACLVYQLEQQRLNSGSNPNNKLFFLKQECKAIAHSMMEFEQGWR